MKINYKIILISLGFGLAFWVIDAVFDFIFFYHETFWNLLVHKLAPIEVYDRLLVLFLFLTFGILLSILLEKRKQVQVEFNKFKTISDKALHGNVIADLEGNLIYVNEYFARIHGYEIHELLGKNLSIMHCEEQMPVVQKCLELMFNNAYFDMMEVWHINKDGTKFPMLMNGMMINDENGAHQYMAATAIDITESKMIEQQRESLLFNLQEAQRIAHVGSWDWDLNSNQVKWSNELYRIYGRDPNKGVPSRETYLDHIHPDDRKALETAIKESIKTGIYEIEYRLFRYNDGEERIVKAKGVVKFDSDGKPLCQVGTVMDVTELRIAVKSLRESEARNHLLLEFAGLGIGYYDLNGTCLLINRKGCENMASTPDKILGRNAIDLFGDEMGNLMLDRINNAALNDNSLKFEDKVCLANNSRWYVSTYTRIQDDNDNIIGVQIISEDITVRKKAEKNLAESESKYRMLAENISDVVWVLDMDLNYTYISPSVEWMRGFTPLEYKNLNLKETHPKESYELIIATVQKEFAIEKQMDTHSNRTVTLEIELFHKQGHKLWNEVNAKFLRDKSGKITGILGQSRDITDRKKAEAQIQKDLKEKEVMLKEIHHRVKNNMQVIISLLNLQSESIKDTKLSSLFEESRNRIYSMALVHEQLYKSNDLSKIEMKSYIEIISNELLKASMNGKKINMNITVDNIFFDINKAIPCGLIINELLTNALKHAFADRDSGEIAITIENSKDNDVQLMVQDNGCGMPETIDLQTFNTLGLNLVTMLTQQLDGVLSIKVDKGTVFDLRFENN